MLKPILLSLVTIAGIQAHAERLNAKDFGLTPETGYLEAVSAEENCDPRTDIRITKDSLSGSYYTFMTKCDGSRIGWVTRTVKPDDVLSGQHASNENDLWLMDEGFTDGSGQRGTNIYVCNDSRADELEQHPQVVPATDPVATEQAILANKAEGKTQYVQLFFNEFVLSGKCIGGVKTLKKMEAPKPLTIDTKNLMKKLKSK